MSKKAKTAWVIIALLALLFTLLPFHIHHTTGEKIIYSVGAVLLVFLLYLIVEIGFFKEEK
jgi:membrane protein YdbS with pleckstrin-like domain